MSRLIPAIILCALGSASAAATLPNIVLLMGDDHGWEETGYNGHPACEDARAR